jgi:hypothetical protein
MADSISNLPVDDSPAIPEDADLVKTYMTINNNKEDIKKVFGSNRDILLCTLFFFILSIPQTDSLINAIYTPAAENTFYRIAIKSLIFLIIVFIINNISYMKAPKS